MKSLTLNSDRLAQISADTRSNSLHDFRGERYFVSIAGQKELKRLKKPTIRNITEVGYSFVDGNCIIVSHRHIEGDVLSKRAVTAENKSINEAVYRMLEETGEIERIASIVASCKKRDALFCTLFRIQAVIEMLRISQHKKGRKENKELEECLKRVNAVIKKMGLSFIAKAASLDNSIFDTTENMAKVCDELAVRMYNEISEMLDKCKLTRDELEVLLGMKDIEIQAEAEKATWLHSYCCSDMNKMILFLERFDYAEEITLALLSCADKCCDKAMLRDWWQLLHLNCMGIAEDTVSLFSAIAHEAEQMSAEAINIVPVTKHHTAAKKEKLLWYKGERNINRVQQFEMCMENELGTRCDVVTKKKSFYDVERSDAD